MTGREAWIEALRERERDVFEDEAWPTPYVMLAPGDLGALLDIAEAAQAALIAWSRMPDAGLGDDDPRRAWWFETARERDALRSALAGAEDSQGQEPS